jgi:A/G-specific adenine glycosylase
LPQDYRKHSDATFPKGLDAIAALPGVGRSTGAAIAVFAYHKRAPILDGNVKRVLARHHGIAGYPGTPKVAAKLWRISETLLPTRAVATYTQALMDLGATVCTRTKPRCGECPVAIDCRAARDGRIDELPTRSAKSAPPQRAVRVLVIERAGTILLEKRPAIGVWGGLWSLPELDVAADVAKHCRARFGARVVAGAELAPVEHGFTHFQLTLRPQRVAVREWPPGAESPGLVWLSREDALAAALPAPIRRLIRSL